MGDHRVHQENRDSARSRFAQNWLKLIPAAVLVGGVLYLLRHERHERTTLTNAIDEELDSKPAEQHVDDLESLANTEQNQAPTPMEPRSFLQRPVRSSLSISWIWFIPQVVFAIFVLYWIRHLPVPGFAIGALALLAVVATLEEEPSRLQRAIWIVVGFGLLFVEGQAIFKDRTQNQTEQAEIRATDQLRFLQTTATLTKTLNAAKQSFDSAERSRLNTIPRANIEAFKLENIARASSANQPLPLAFGGAGPIGINVVFHNTGSGAASDIWSFFKLYVDTPDSPEAQRRIAKLFETDWRASKHKHAASIGPNTNPVWETYFQTLSDDDLKGLQSRKKTVYYIFRALYADPAGAWYQDTCGVYHEPLNNTAIIELCPEIRPEKHLVGTAYYKKYGR